MHRARRTSKNTRKGLRFAACRAHEARRPESSTVESRDRHPRVVDSNRDRHAPVELEALFHSASGVPADRREAWIESQCARGVPRELARRAAALAARVDGSCDIEPVSRSSQDEARVIRSLAQGAGGRAAFATGAGLALVLAPHAASTSLSKTITSERNEMIAIRAESVLAAAAAASIAAAATAQDAVQWRVEDGGNGHWYFVDTTDRAWSASRIYAESIGGHLATLTTQGEQNFVENLPGVEEQGCAGPAIGLIQSPIGTEPGGGWSWITGEPLVFTSWGFIPGIPQQPDDSVGGPPKGLCDRGALWCPPWHDWEDVPDTNDYTIGAIIEWSSDCNNDGLVDYGQIRAGALDDTNANNIPDCCEIASLLCCPGDIDRSGEVNGVDLAIVLQAWGGSKQYPEADLDGDGTVNGSDLATVLNSWGACP
jgi:hypothetical protein